MVLGSRERTCPLASGGSNVRPAMSSGWHWDLPPCGGVVQIGAPGQRPRRAGRGGCDDQHPLGLVAGVVPGAVGPPAQAPGTQDRTTVGGEIRPHRAGEPARPMPPGRRLIRGVKGGEGVLEIPVRQARQGRYARRKVLGRVMRRPGDLRGPSPRPGGARSRRRRADPGDRPSHAARWP